MSRKRAFIKGSIILTIAGFTSRILGFFYRIFLSNTIGAHGMGIYQLIFPVYAICLAISSASIQTAISKCSAEQDEINGSSKTVLISGLAMSLILSLSCFMAVYYGADIIATYFLHETSCTPLLKIMALALPLDSIHSCINGYYYGKNKTLIPAFSQLLEQIARVLTMYIVYTIFMTYNTPITPVIAVYGLFTGELASSLFTGTSILLSKKGNVFRARLFYPYCKDILSVSVPLTLNRLLITFLTSVESLLIPIALRKYGYSSTAALSVYGILTGMSMSFIFFPGTITNSIAVILLPAIAKANTLSDKKIISKSITASIKLSVIIGIFFTGIFLCFGTELGESIFNNVLCGRFIAILSFMCPFLYLSTMLSSILNGLTLIKINLINNCINILLRIIIIIFFIPLFGIHAYLTGILLSQLVLAALHLYKLYIRYHFSFNAIDTIIKPVLSCIISIGTAYFITYLDLPFNRLIIILIKCLVAFIFYFLIIIKGNIHQIK